MRALRHSLIVAAAAGLLVPAGSAQALTSGAMSANKPITASTTLHNGIRTSVPRLSAHVSKHSDLILTTQREHRIWRWLHGRKDQKKPTGFTAHIGADLPASVKLHKFPRKLAGETPPIAGMRYAKLSGKVVVVRPADRKIEQVIKTPS